MAQICNTAKQDSVAQLCNVIATTVAFQVMLNYKMGVFPLSNFLYQILHCNMGIFTASVFKRCPKC